MIPVLVSITLTGHFHASVPLKAILLLKEETSRLLGVLISKFHQKFELKTGYADFLTRQICESDGDLNPLTAYGCLGAIRAFGPHIAAQSLAPVISKVYARLQNGASEAETAYLVSLNVTALKEMCAEIQTQLETSRANEGLRAEFATGVMEAFG